MSTFAASNNTLINTGLSTHYNAYMKRKRLSRKHHVDKYELMRICMAILKEIGTQIYEAKGGVFIKNFGYFFILKTQQKMIFGKNYLSNGKKTQFNHHTDYYRYTPIFYPAGGPMNLRFWSMDYKFANNVKQGIKAKLKSGFRYKMYAYTLKKLLNLN